MAESIAYNCDCMEYMRTLPDNAFDLAVVDPPYGDGCSQSVQVERERERERESSPPSAARTSKERPTAGRNMGLREMASGGTASDRGSTATKSGADGCARTGGTWAEKYGKKIIAWDVAPEKEYFQELFRVSRNQIIWGGNYFALPPTRCFLVWRKLSISESFSMAMAEYAWTSFNGNAKVFEKTPQGDPNDPRFHPTSKPIQLYDWIFANYAKHGDRILDTHLGSGSSRIAAYNAGLDFVGCEIDETYFRLQEERFARYSAQLNFFNEEV